MSSFFSYLINGVSLGSIYALIALGYTMVYGIAKMLNFAHGDVIMIGGYMTFVVGTALGMPVWLTILFGILVCTVLGVTIEKIAYKPLRAATSLAVLITAIGVSYFLQNSALLIWKAAARSYPPVVTGSVKIFGGKLTVSYISLLTISACVVIMIALTLFVSKSKMGKAMRATAQNRKMAMLLGIDADRIISLTFIIGSSLAAIGGVLIANHVGQVNFFIGFIAGIKAFTAAVLGGIGSIPGAMVGGLVLGLCESFATGYISSAYEDALAFALLVLILIFRPAGILGKPKVQKV